MPNRATAIVVNWNAGARLSQCVAALRDQRGVELDILIVDNASSDNSLTTLAAAGDRVRVVQTGENLGFGRAINRGLAAADSEIVIALNPDVALQSAAVKTMIAFLDAHPGVGMVGPRLTDADGRTIASCGDAPKLTDEICRKFLLHKLFPLLNFRRRSPAKPEPVDWVTGACFAVRRCAIAAVNGLDEAIFMYYEDVDLGLRLKRAGWQVVYLPHASGTHIGGESAKHALARMLVVSEASYAYFIRKHLGHWASRLLLALRPIEMMLRVALWAGAFLLSRSCRTEARARLRAYWFVLTRGAVEEAHDTHFSSLV